MMQGAVKRGFTIIELAMCIAIIALLVTVSAVAYKGVTDRARNTQRLADMKNITEALAIYRQSQKQYPGERVANTWERSDAYPTSFLNNLKTSGLVKSVPVDPENSSDYFYRYMLYSAGDQGCDATKGAFYVLQVMNMKNITARAEGNPGFSCSLHDWTAENGAWFTTGAYIAG